MRFKSQVSFGAIAAVTGVTGVGAQDQTARIEEIQVTATKRVESTQDVPVAVSALGESTLEDANVNVFTDYLLQLPGVTAGGAGPGQGTIYIRGLASTTPNLTVAGASGLAPNVALYLDEQPVTQVGRNLDVYAADLNRVEVLSGPQGTLFGASSQSGTIRLITNKPDVTGFYGSVNGGLSYTEGGEASQKIEAMINVPIVEDKFALRGVFFLDDQGGYIDNVLGSRTAAESARFQQGFVRPNGVPASDGFQAGADLSGVTFLDATNTELVEDNFNDATYTGFRVSALYDVNEDWTVTASHMRQQLETEGVFFIDPELDDDDELSVQRFSNDESTDEFSSTSLTIEGSLGDLDVVYAGSFLDRETESVVDYTDYLFVGQYIPYYICDVSVSYPADAPTGTCQAPQLFVDGENLSDTWTHELRFTTPGDKPLRATFGGFLSDQTLIENNSFSYPGSRFIDSGVDGVTGFPQNGPVSNATVSDTSLRPPGVIFFNDIRRTDKQRGLFGELTYDINDQFSITGGLRYYDVRVRLRGSADFSFFNLGQTVDQNGFVVNLDELFDGTNNPRQAVADGVVFKGTLTYTPNDDMLFYVTYSEGFRPGLPNRPGGATGATGTVPFIVRTDEVENYEFGWKLDLLDGRLRFNGSAFYVDITDLQSAVFDPVGAGTNLFFADNAANAEIYGLEGNIAWAPESIPGLVINGAFSILDTKTTELVGVSSNFAEEGADLAYAPTFQGNLRARYEWDWNSDWVAHVQPAITYSDGSFSDIVTVNRARQDSYFLANFAVGISNADYGFEIYAENLTDERAQLNNNLVFDRERIAINRPRTVGFRFRVNY